jgi:hypothetical protein
MKFANGIGLGIPATNGLGLVLQTVCRPFNVRLRGQGGHHKLALPCPVVWHEWLTSKSGLDAITSYKIAGEEVFFPPRPEEIH